MLIEAKVCISHSLLLFFVPFARLVFTAKTADIILSCKTDSHSRIPIDISGISKKSRQNI